MSRPVLSVIVLPAGGSAAGMDLRRAFERQSVGPLEMIEARVSFRDATPTPQERMLSVPEGVALNFAAGKAQSRLLAFIRSDLAPVPTWAEAATKALSAHGEGALVQGSTASGAGPAPGPLHCALSADLLRRTGGFAEAVPPACIANRPTGGLSGSEIGELVECRGMLARYRAPGDGCPPACPCGPALPPSPFLSEVSPGLTAQQAGAAPAASVIVPVRGRPEWLALGMESLRHQDMAEPYEVLVAAAGCPEDVGRLREEYPWARVIPCGGGPGPGAQRNRAMGEARGDYVVLTDDDCIAQRDWLRTMVETCRNRDGSVVWGWVATAYPWDPNSRALNVSENGQFRPAGPVLTHGVGGGNMCVASALVRESGARFAEGVYGAEEMQFLLALPRRARPVTHEPRAVVRHLRNDDFAGSLARQYRLGRGSARVRSRIRMRGSLAARWPFLSPLLAPTRYLLTTCRVLRSSPGELVDFLRLSPLIALHHACYAAGFAVGALTAGRDRRGVAG
jgi:hypothetical protein